MAMHWDQSRKFNALLLPLLERINLPATFQLIVIYGYDMQTSMFRSYLYSNLEGFDSSAGLLSVI